MKIVLRLGDREAERDLAMSTSLKESLRRIKLTQVRDPGSVLAYQVSQEIRFLIRREDVLTQLVQELLRELNEEDLQRRDP
jgi:hypothetical protein